MVIPELLERSGAILEVTKDADGTVKNVFLITPKYESLTKKELAFMLLHCETITNIMGMQLQAKEAAEVKRLSEEATNRAAAFEGALNAEEARV